MTLHTSNPAVVDPLALSGLIQYDYSNVSLNSVNDHEIRMSVMTEQFRWHRHPDSDETFYGTRAVHNCARRRASPHAPRRGEIRQSHVRAKERQDCLRRVIIADVCNE